MDFIANLLKNNYNHKTGRIQKSLQIMNTYFTGKFTISQYVKQKTGW